MRGRRARGLMGFVRSLPAATRGVALALRQGPNLRLQSLTGVLALGTGAVLGVGPVRIAVLALTTAVVLAAEVGNTAVERLCDLVDDEHGLGVDPRIRDVKDLAAGAVLVTAVGAVAVGAAILAPALLALALLALALLHP